MQESFSHHIKNPHILKALEHFNFHTMTEVQALSIPKILAKKDILVQAKTGSGKSLAFGIPLLEMLEKEQKNPTKLILAPTRELATQLSDSLRQVASFRANTKIITLTGGTPLRAQAKSIEHGAGFTIGTPGRILDHLEKETLTLKSIDTLVLDEADRMLDIGFYEDILKIISYVPEKRQTLMFSATMASKIRKLAAQILHQPVEINIAMSKPATGVLQAVYPCYENQKIGLIHSLISDNPDYSSILIFCSTKKKVTELARSLKKSKFAAEAISSDLEQTEREKVLQAFKARRIRILVATDVLSRGIDIKEIHLIINYDVPHDAEDYVHRVGRTARADATGVALTLVNDKEMGKFHQIERLIEREVIKLPLPEGLGEGPEWKKSTPRRKPGGKGRAGKSGNSSSSRRHHPGGNQPGNRRKSSGR